MNSLIIKPECIQKREGEVLSISSSKIYKHLTEVLNKTPNLDNNKLYKVTIIDEGIFFAEILSATPSEIIFKLKDTIPSPLSLLPWIDIIVGVARPQTMKKVLEHGTSFGVREFNIFQATLSEKSYLTSKIYTDSIDDLLTDGLAQSARYFTTPKVILNEENPAKSYQFYDYKFVLDFENAQTFADYQLPDLSKSTALGDMPKIVIAIGPERGFRANDLRHFIENGFKIITISKSTLRVEHALFAALGQLELLTKHT